MKTLKNEVTKIKENILLHGGTQFDDNCLPLSWSGAGFTVRFVGRTVEVGFLPYLSSSAADASEDERYIVLKVIIDGQAYKTVISDRRQTVITDDLGEGEHTLTVLKLNESQEPIRVEYLTLFGRQAEFLPAIREHHSFRIEVLGDSITCGYGVLGSEDLFRAIEEDPTRAYAYLAASELNAETRLISWSGRGLAKAYDGNAENRFIDFFSQKMRDPARGKHDFSDWQPDVLVINGGTNDNSSAAVSYSEFEEKLNELYTFVRKVYPRAKILFFYGAMGGNYDPVYSSFVDRIRESDTDVFYKNVRAVDDKLDEIGANGHPSVIGQRRLADELKAALEEIMKR